MCRTGDEDCDMFKEFEVSAEDLQLARNSVGCGYIDYDNTLGVDSQLSPQPSCSKSLDIQEGSHALSHVPVQDYNLAPPLSPSVEGSDKEDSPTSSFTFAGEPGSAKSIKKLSIIAKHAQHDWLAVAVVCAAIECCSVLTVFELYLVGLRPHGEALCKFARRFMPNPSVSGGTA